jgi:HSP90 family molecular chaperone
MSSYFASDVDEFAVMMLQDYDKIPFKNIAEEMIRRASPKRKRQARRISQPPTSGPSTISRKP